MAVAVTVAVCLLLLPWKKPNRNRNLVTITVVAWSSPYRISLSKDAVTLARLHRRYLSTGALPRESTVVIDEISLLTHRDFETCVLPLARLGVQLILIGDPASQLLAISDIGANGEELAQDISESVMLKSAVHASRRSPAAPRYPRRFASAPLRLPTAGGRAHRS